MFNNFHRLNNHVQEQQKNVQYIFVVAIHFNFNFFEYMGQQISYLLVNNPKN